MKKKIISLLRLIYQSVKILSPIKRVVWKIFHFKMLKKYLPTSSSQNQLALAELTKRRFEYTDNFFNKNHQVIQHEQVEIDISVVTYNSSQWVDNFFKSLLAQDYPTQKINLYFIDNSSKDNTLEVLRNYKDREKDSFNSIVLISQKNLGFGSGHDKTFKEGKTEFCLVTNIDLEFEKDSIKNVVNIALADKNEEYASWEFRQIPFEHPKYYDPVTLETNWSSHACILIRKSAYQKVRGYEPKIFMYAEDVELSYRFRAYGYHLKYCPSAVVHHFTYEYVNQVKPLQFSGSTLGNSYLRLRYGNIIDKIAIIPLYSALILRKERFKGSRKIVLKNIMQIIKNKNYFSSFVAKNSNFYAPFREFDYELIRDGAFYSVNILVEKPLVSIIVRTYQGRDQLLKQCLLSIMNQTYTNIEIIVVEDGGTAMKSIVESLHGCANIHYHAQAKVGRSVTGNFGLANSNGVYCLFLDDDDLIFADHIEVLISTLQKHPNASAAYSLAFLVPTNMNQDKSHYKEEDYTTLKLFYQPFDYEVLCDHNYFPIQSVLFKKELFLARGGIDESLTYLEDWNMWLRYAYNNTFVYIPKTTSLYRIPANNKMQNERHALLHQAYNDAKQKAMHAIKELNL